MDLRNKIIGSIMLSLIIVLLFQGCSSDDPDDGNQMDQESGTIDAAFKPYVERFITEMNERGLNLSSNGLSVVFVDNITMPNSDRFCAYGYVNFQNSGKPRVEVINTERCWGRWSDSEKENLMFHELGHALLQKGHINGTLPNGSQKSIMCASETCNNYRVYNSNQALQMDYYLDELVNPQIEIPDWAVQKTFSKTISEDSFDNEIEGWTSVIGEDPNNEMPYDFYIEDERLFSSPNALAIQSTTDFSQNTYGQWQKTYTISDFENCSNILVRADITIEDFSTGTIGIAIDLLEKNSEDDLNFFARYSSATRNYNSGRNQNENFASEVICIPEETAAIRVLLYMNGVNEGSIASFDNLEIELYE